MVDQLVLALNMIHQRPKDLLPKHLENAKVHRVVIAQRNVRLPEQANRELMSTYSFTTLPEGIEFLLTRQPDPKAIVRPGAAFSKVTAFYHLMGELQYNLMPGSLSLLHEEVVKYLGLTDALIRRDSKAYQPDGPWEYIPPEYARDWRVRARWVIPIKPEHVSLTQLALHTTYRKLYRAVATIDYTLASTGSS